jgi:hypothetical protein
LAAYLPDRDVVWLIGRVVESFQSTGAGKGLPLGNLTSQLLVNVYMNSFDAFVKHGLRAKHYIRYADDFVVMDTDRRRLEEILREIDSFLREELSLVLHPDKISIRTFASGVDFLGWVHFPDHRVLRTATKRRMLKKLGAVGAESKYSYLGMLKHGNTFKLRQKIETPPSGGVSRSL